MPQAQAANVPPGFAYNRAMRQYRNTTSGRFVSTREIYKLLDVNVDASNETLLAVTRALAEGRIEPSTWLLAMQKQLANLHVQNGALGAGGFDNLRSTDWTRIDGFVRDDVERLVKFGNSIIHKELSNAQIVARVALYVGTARRQFFLSRRRPQTTHGQTVIERRVLGGEENCSFCKRLAEMGWQHYGVLPTPGESADEWNGDQCISNCRCHMEVKVVGRAEARRVVKKISPFWLTPNGKSFSIWPDWLPVDLPNDILAGMKGGPGSGFPNHEGRPDKQGGSLPDGIPNKDGSEEGGGAGEKVDERGEKLSGFGQRESALALINAMVSPLPASQTMDEEEHEMRLVESAQVASELRSLVEKSGIPQMQRVWTGKQLEKVTGATKIETGKMVETVVERVMTQVFGSPFVNGNMGRNNAPIDVIARGLAIECKGGASTNGKSARHWRITFNESPAEKAYKRTLTKEEESEYNARCGYEAVERKRAAVSDMSKMSGISVKPMTFTGIISPDQKSVDIFAFSGFHKYMGWNRLARDEYYVGTFSTE